MNQKHITNLRNKFTKCIQNLIQWCDITDWKFQEIFFKWKIL